MQQLSTYDSAFYANAILYSETPILHLGEPPGTGSYALQDQSEYHVSFLGADVAPPLSLSNNVEGLVKGIAWIYIVATHQ